LFLPAFLLVFTHLEKGSGLEQGNLFEE
jgi:hypothetical protein